MATDLPKTPEQPLSTFIEIKDQTCMGLLKIELDPNSLKRLGYVRDYFYNIIFGIYYKTSALGLMPDEGYDNPILNKRMGGYKLTSRESGIIDIICLPFYNTAINMNMSSERSRLKKQMFSRPIEVTSAIIEEDLWRIDPLDNATGYVISNTPDKVLEDSIRLTIDLKESEVSTLEENKRDLFLYARIGLAMAHLINAFAFIDDNDPNLVLIKVRGLDFFNSQIDTLFNTVDVFVKVYTQYLDSKE